MRITLGMALMTFATTSISQAQDFALYEDVYVHPGSSADYAQLRLDRVRRMAAAGVTFGSRTFENESYFRTVTVLSDMAELDERRTQLEAMTPGNATLARETIHRIDTSIVHMRPDLSYQPTTPRVPLDETEYARGIDYYLKFGTRAEATEIVKQIRHLLEANNAPVGFTVDFKVTGGGADLSVFLYARNVADFYSNYSTYFPPTGDLLAQLNALCYRIDRFHSYRRQDLDFSPVN